MPTKRYKTYTFDGTTPLPLHDQTVHTYTTLRRSLNNALQAASFNVLENGAPIRM